MSTTEVKSRNWNWPNYLKNPDTRISHIVILVVTVILLVFSIIVIVWTAYRTSAPADNEITYNQATTRTLYRTIMERDCVQDPNMPTSSYTFIGNDLVDPFSTGTHFIRQGECIKSKDCKFQLQLTHDGNAELWNLETHIKMYESFTVNKDSPGQKFLCGCDGFCYILRDDGTRSKQTIGEKGFYQSPNQVCPYFKDKKTNNTEYWNHPYQLEFYEQGLCLWSGRSNSKDGKLSKPIRTNLWWVSVGGVQPWGIPPEAGTTYPKDSFVCYR